MVSYTLAKLNKQIIDLSLELFKSLYRIYSNPLATVREEEKKKRHHSSSIYTFNKLNRFFFLNAYLADVRQ